MPILWSMRTSDGNYINFIEIWEDWTGRCVIPRNGSMICAGWPLPVSRTFWGRLIPSGTNPQVEAFLALSEGHNDRRAN